MAGNFYSIANIYSTFPSYVPLIEIELHLGRVGNSWNGQYDLAITYRNGGWYPDWSVVKNFPWMALRGRWFKIAWYVKIHNTSGMVKVWVDDVLICDKSGVAVPKNQGPYIIIGKVYYGNMDLIPKKLWVDDIELWDGLPSGAPPIPLPIPLWKMGLLWLSILLPAGAVVIRKKRRR